MWGTPNCLSRTMTTSSRGEYVRSTWSGGTPKVESLKYLSSWSAGTAREGTSGAALVRHNTGTDAGRRHSCRELRADAARGEDRVGVGERAGVHDRGREVRSARQAGGRVEVERQRAGRAELDGAPAVADGRRAELAAGAADGHRARLGRHV